MARFNPVDRDYLFSNSTDRIRDLGSGDVESFNPVDRDYLFSKLVKSDGSAVSATGAPVSIPLIGIICFLITQCGRL